MPVLCVYILRNMRGRTYVGFTNNPARRLRQHNGEVAGGARKTRLGRPWQMLLFVHGFSSKVRALQFEWGLQHPTMSRFLKKGGLEGVRVGKRSFAASTLVQVLAGLLACNDFAHEPLGVHLLRGHWASPPLAAPDAKLEEALSRALARQPPRAAGPIAVSHGCPVAAHVLPPKRHTRPDDDKLTDTPPTEWSDDDQEGDAEAEEAGLELARMLQGSSSGDESEALDERTIAATLHDSDASGDGVDFASDEDSQAAAPPYARARGSCGSAALSGNPAVECSATMIDLTADDDDDEEVTSPMAEESASDADEQVGTSLAWRLSRRRRASIELLAPDDGRVESWRR